MVDLLRRSISPVTDEAWEELDSQAVKVLKNLLTGRSVVDFKGPLGWKAGSVDLGRLEIPKEQKIKGVYWGTRKVLPLVEIRIPFTLKQAELDDINRGSEDPDLSPLEEAADKLAQFEDGAIYHGFSEGCIKGLLESSAHRPIKIGGSQDDLAKGIAAGVEALKKAAIGGPFALVLGSKPHQVLLERGGGGYPAHKYVSELLGGPVLSSPQLKGGVLLSTRGEDFELIVGQDISIGYCSHDREQIEFYLTESMTFRVLEPAAVVELKTGA